MKPNLIEPKTFKDFGLTFEFDETCLSCSEGSCHNNVISKYNGKEYNVHISTNFEGTFFSITASENSNTSSSDDISEFFTNEKEAVDFVCKNFDWFKCV